jgi:hypothetical protein
MQKASKIKRAGYAGRRSVATGEGLKICKKQPKYAGPGMQAEGLWPLAKGSKYAKRKQNTPGRVCRQKVCGHWRKAQSMQKVNKIRRAGYAGRRSVATGEGLKICKKQAKYARPGMQAEGLWPLAKSSKCAKSKQNKAGRVCWQKVPGHWRRAQSMQKASKKIWAGYAGRRSVATGEGLKVYKRQAKYAGPGMPAEGLWPLANGSKYAKKKQNKPGRVCRQKVCGHGRMAQNIQKANKICRAGYAGRRSVATGERLKVFKKQPKYAGPGMPAEGLWPLAKGSKYAKSEQNKPGRVCRQKVCGHWRRAQSMQEESKIGRAGYAGRRSVATCEALKVCKKQAK